MTVRLMLLRVIPLVATWWQRISPESVPLFPRDMCFFWNELIWRVSPGSCSWKEIWVRHRAAKSWLLMLEFLWWLTQHHNLLLPNSLGKIGLLDMIIKTGVNVTTTDRSMCLIRLQVYDITLIEFRTLHRIYSLFIVFLIVGTISCNFRLFHHQTESLFCMFTWNFFFFNHFPWPSVLGLFWEIESRMGKLPQLE